VYSFPTARKSEAPDGQTDGERHLTQPPRERGPHFNIRHSHTRALACWVRPAWPVHCLGRSISGWCCQWTSPSSRAGRLAGFAVDRDTTTFPGSLASRRSPTIELHHSNIM